MLSMSELEEGRHIAEVLRNWLKRLGEAEQMFAAAKEALDLHTRLQAEILQLQAQLAIAQRDCNAAMDALLHLHQEQAALPAAIAEERAALEAIMRAEVQAEIECCREQLTGELSGLERARADASMELALLQDAAVLLQEQVATHRQTLASLREQASMLLGVA